jgi:TonB family protein
LEERVKTIAPQYPYGERARHHEGRGYFQLTLDPKTGLVTKVAVIKSTGFPVLDNSATSALRQWKWKRGRWKEIDMPVTFEIREPTVPLPKGAIPLPNG